MFTKLLNTSTRRSIMKLVEVEMEVVRFEVEDVIATSNETEIG